jgi:hypothetical protein
VKRVHGAVDHGQHRSMMDRGQRVRRRLADVWSVGAGAHRCSPAMEGEDELIEAVLTGDGGVAERRRVELVVRAKEGAKELRREGMRCGESRGSHRPFMGAGGAPERGGRGDHRWR